MPRLARCRRRLPLSRFSGLVLSFLFLIIFLFVLLPFITNPLGPYAQLEYLAGILRPVWDRKPPIPERYVVDWSVASDDSNVELTDEEWTARCALNGWVSRKSVGEKTPRLWDIIHFSNDPELLEVRLHEIGNVVDVIVIAESGVTFTGRPKRKWWNEVVRDELMVRELRPWDAVQKQIQETRIIAARDPSNATAWKHLAALARKQSHYLAPSVFAKIHHLDYTPFEATYTPNATTPAQAWENEGLQRSWVYERIVFGSRKLEPGDLLLTSDADEIPRGSLLRTLKMCTGWPGSGSFVKYANPPPANKTEPTALHFKLLNSFYSFSHSFQSTMENWNSNIQVWKEYWETPPIRFHKNSEWIVAKAGWHCSSCIRTLKGVEEKLLSYSHFDRLGTGRRRRLLLDRKRMQRALCTGANLFGFVPEEWEFRHLISRLHGAVRRPGEEPGVDAPRWLVNEVARERRAGAKRLRYLLGGTDCVREDFDGSWDDLGIVAP